MDAYESKNRLEEGRELVLNAFITGVFPLKSA